MAGTKDTVSLAMQKAERFRTELLSRGVLLVPVIWGEGKGPKVEKKGFGSPTKAAAALPSIGVRWSTWKFTNFSLACLNSQVLLNFLTLYLWETW